MHLPTLPFLMLVAGLILALPVLHLARGPAADRRWFPWFLLALLPLPRLLQLLQLDFVGMLSIYLAWPATMGPLALLLPSLNSFLAWNDPLFWTAALGFSLLWLALLRQIWLRRKGVAAALWFLGLLASGLPLYLWLLPPD